MVVRRASSTREVHLSKALSPMVVREAGRVCELDEGGAGLEGAPAHSGEGGREGELDEGGAF